MRFLPLIPILILTILTSGCTSTKIPEELVKATEEITNGLKYGNEAKELINTGLKTNSFDYTTIENKITQAQSHFSKALAYLNQAKKKTNDQKILTAIDNGIKGCELYSKSLINLSVYIDFKKTFLDTMDPNICLQMNDLECYQSYLKTKQKVDERLLTSTQLSTEAAGYLQKYINALK
jgi:hypothetical protein